MKQLSKRDNYVYDKDNKKKETGTNNVNQF